MISQVPRVRFAPSPTGYLHVGGLRTALYNYLFARQKGGVFVLRIEDTDRNRFVEGAVENLIDTLHWAGLSFDEGPGVGGKFGPYMQSQRLNIYSEHIDYLLREKKAYRCFCTPERLDEMRKKLEIAGGQPMYDKHCLHYTEEESAAKAAAGEKFVIRMNVPANRTVVVQDTIRGRVEFNSSVVDDQILIKTDGYPTYHLANVVDDHLMQITHVIRGEEWLPSTPKHVLLYEAFGWEIPQFAHLPLLLNPDKSKLSKRQGDVAVEDYRSKGYLKEALVNFVSLLGWNAGDDREMYQLDELVQAFSLDRVNKAGAVFQLDKLNWLNQEHLKMKHAAELAKELHSIIKTDYPDWEEVCQEYLEQVVPLMKERITFLADIPKQAPYFFIAPDTFDEKARGKAWNPETRSLMEKLVAKYTATEGEPTKDVYESLLRQTAEESGASAGKIIHAVRLAASGVAGGPGLFEMLAVIGKQETVTRIEKAISLIE